MPSDKQLSIRQERIDAYDEILGLFPSATDMARELSLDKRASVGQWKKRGVPMEYIMILDILGMISKDVLIPSVANWDVHLSKYEQVIRNKLNKMLLVDSLKKTATTTLNSVLEPTVNNLVTRALIDAGVIKAPTKAAAPEAEDLM